MKIVFIGAGNMAEALVRGLVARKNGDAITVTDTRPERLGYFREKFAVFCESSNATAASSADVVVLSVKPQVMTEVLADLKDHVPARALVISIAAGIPAAKIESGLSGQPHVVRAMPNTPALVGAGVSAICAGRFATGDDLALAESLLGAVGVVTRVEEQMMDAVTALSGSGPAYVFYLMEAMLSAAKKLNMNDSVARQLVYRTIEGAAKLAAQSDVGPAELRGRVTSKGGTTAAAIALLDEKGVRAAIEQAVAAAHRRSQELSGI